LPYYEAVDLSQCVNVRIVHVGTIELDHISRSGEQTSPMMSIMWNLLCTLSSHSCSLEEVVLILRPVGETPEARAADLEGFSWLDLIRKLQEIFPNLKMITVGVGYHMWDNEDFVAALRRAPGLRQLEEKGTVLLQLIPWRTYGSVRPSLKY
jgi:hypothetical protein